MKTKNFAGRLAFSLAALAADRARFSAFFSAFAVQHWHCRAFVD
jgi:hypothetical protein